jgi:hypothetical protein
MQEDTITGIEDIDHHGTAGESKMSTLFFAVGLERGVSKPETTFKDITGIESCLGAFISLSSSVMVESFNRLDRGLYKPDSSFGDITGIISFEFVQVQASPKVQAPQQIGRDHLLLYNCHIQFISDRIPQHCFASSRPPTIGATISPSATTLCLGDVAASSFCCIISLAMGSPLLFCIHWVISKTIRLLGNQQIFS